MTRSILARVVVDLLPDISLAPGPGRYHGGFCPAASATAWVCRARGRCDGGSRFL